MSFTLNSDVETAIASKTVVNVRSSKKSKTKEVKTENVEANSTGHATANVGAGSVDDDHQEDFRPRKDPKSRLQKRIEENEDAVTQLASQSFMIAKAVKNVKDYNDMCSAKINDLEEMVKQLRLENDRKDQALTQLNAKAAEESHKWEERFAALSTSFDASRKASEEKVAALSSTLEKEKRARELFDASTESKQQERKEKMEQTAKMLQETNAVLEALGFDL